MKKLYDFLAHAPQNQSVFLMLAIFTAIGACQPIWKFLTYLSIFLKSIYHIGIIKTYHSFLKSTEVMSDKLFLLGSERAEIIATYSFNSLTLGFVVVSLYILTVIQFLLSIAVISKFGVHKVDDFTKISPVFALLVCLIATTIWQYDMIFQRLVYRRLRKKIAEAKGIEIP